MNLTSSTYDFLKEINIFLENEIKEDFIIKYSFDDIKETEISIEFDISIKTKNNDNNATIIKGKRSKNKRTSKGLF